MTVPDVSVVIVAYRTPELVDRCLASLQTHVQVPHEVVVVDNAPGDGTGALVRGRHPGVTLIESAGNVGFAAAVNAGSARARGRYVLLLNPDTELRDDAVAAVVRFADSNSRHQVYGGRTVLPSGELDARSCFGAPTLWSAFCWATGLSRLLRGNAVFDPESLGNWPRDTVRPVPVITGCFLLVTRELWHRLGGLDERYFLFSEDVDFSLRAASAGAEPVHVPSSEIVHHYGASPTPRAERMVLLLAGRVTMFRQHWPEVNARAGTALLSLGVLVRMLGLQAVDALSGHPRSPRAEAYRGTWLQRERWRAGYPAAAPPR